MVMGWVAYHWRASPGGGLDLQRAEFPSWNRYVIIASIECQTDILYHYLNNLYYVTSLYEVYKISISSYFS